MINFRFFVSSILRTDINNIKADFVIDLRGSPKVSSITINYFL